MKSALKLFIAVFFILAVIKNLEAQYTSIGGKVYYADNNQPVTSGVVKVYETGGSLVGVVPISSNGDWIIAAVRYYGNYDVIGIADDEWEEDALPTGYPDKIEQEDYIPVYVQPDVQQDINIYIQRATSLMRPGLTSEITGRITLGNKPAADAMIFAKQDDKYYGYAITDSKGNYTIKDLPVGNYTLVAGKVGCISTRENVNLGEKGLNISFTIAPKGSETVNNVPNRYSLSQNYPNPFNPSTVISYSVPSASNVKLNVYSSDGKLVKELVNSVQEAGSYNVSFEGSSLSSGIYFYTLSANGFSETRKMILVK